MLVSLELSLLSSSLVFCFSFRCACGHGRDAGDPGPAGLGEPILESGPVVSKVEGRGVSSSDEGGREVFVVDGGQRHTIDSGI